MIKLKDYLKQFFCKHNWMFVKDVSAQKFGIHVRIHRCQKCGKYREERILE